jgi:aryl-alcohol dehydrogenase-like predicted oxidoreductase
MQYSKLGNTGLTVSRICLGCMSYGDGKWREWTIGADQAREHFVAALDAGVNFFDTADVYSAGVSEEITGRWLNDMASRDDIVLATKVHGPMGKGPNRRGLSRKHIFEACDNSLRRLKTDYIDLYQIHRWDFSTPIEETLDALDTSRASREGPLSRRKQYGSLAILEGTLHCQGTWLAAFCSHAESLQPDLS